MVNKCNVSAKHWKCFTGNRELYSGNVTIMPHETCNLGVTCTLSFLWVWMLACAASSSAIGLSYHNSAVEHDGEVVEPSQWRRMDFCAVIPFTNSPVTRAFFCLPQSPVSAHLYSPKTWTWFSSLSKHSLTVIIEDHSSPGSPTCLCYKIRII